MYRFLLLFIIPIDLFANQYCPDKSNCLLDKSTQKNTVQHVNIFGKKLVVCSKRPLTGYYRSGKCESDINDRANHSVCAQVTDEFLDFTKKLGNDLSTPNPFYGFEGLMPGDSWCLCASRWKEAYDAGIKLKVNLEATHMRALEVINKEDLGVNN